MKRRPNAFFKKTAADKLIVLLLVFSFISAAFLSSCGGNKEKEPDATKTSATGSAQSSSSAPASSNTDPTEKTGDTERYSFYNEFDKETDVNALVKKLEENGYISEYKSKADLDDERYSSFTGRYYLYPENENRHISGDYTIISVIENAEEAHKIFERSFTEQTYYPVAVVSTLPALYDFVVRMGSVIVSGKGAGAKYLAECAGIDISPISCDTEPVVKNIEINTDVNTLIAYLKSKGYKYYGAFFDEDKDLFDARYCFIDPTDGSLLQFEHYQPLKSGYRTVKELVGEMVQSCADMNIAGETLLYNDIYVFASVGDKWSELLAPFISSSTSVKVESVERYYCYHESDKETDVNALVKALEKEGYKSVYKSKADMKSSSSLDEAEFEEKYGCYTGRYELFPEKDGEAGSDTDYTFISVIESAEKAHELFERSLKGPSDIGAGAVNSAPVDDDYTIRRGNVIISGKGESGGYIADEIDIDPLMYVCDTAPEKLKLFKDIDVSILVDFMKSRGYTVYEDKYVRDGETEPYAYTYGFVDSEYGYLLQLEYRPEKFDTPMDDLVDALCESCVKRNIAGVTFQYNDKYLFVSVKDDWSRIIDLFPSSWEDVRNAGDGIVWDLSDDGTLTLSGTGRMKDYDNLDNRSPWYVLSGRIKKIVVSDGITHIGNYAFNDCVNAVSIDIPDSVLTIGDAAFDGCSSLEEIVLPEGIKEICAYTFNDCVSLKEIIIPKGVVSIGDNAFVNCESLTEIIVPDGVETIGETAFYGCSGLTKINLGKNVGYVIDDTFLKCTSLREIIVDPENECLCSVDGVLFDKEKTILYTYPAGKTDATYTVPYGVKNINDSAFSYAYLLTGVTLPDSVDYIGESAFSFSEFLFDITIPESVTLIEEYAVWYCGNVTIHCAKGSKAETYAIENNIPYDNDI